MTPAATSVDHDKRVGSPDSGMYVLFTLAMRQFALPLTVVERSVRIVDITTLPKAPSIVLGVINIAGRIIPVVDLRKRFGLPERGITASDQLLVARTSAQPSARTLALWVDGVDGVVEHAADLVPAVVPGQDTEDVTGILRVAHGLVLIHDLEKLLSLTEGRALDLLLADVAGTRE